ncbi:erythromycin esterase family protein [Streptoalloteichus hindustanus]|uniref:Erythromycin esterase n=1 Tax=Streptoalloteichus hindustanus TaxID=2017 RepID=A0A1M5F0B0_STRHI|nr:erythromycin esterase family protein [Streptoalloteichus hindustanus]SHF84858.1 erythromycin esterase [Streptoalloteichus hindustanus]
MTDTVTEWIKRHAHPLSTQDAWAPLDDQSPWGDIVGDAPLVALGCSTRQTHELSTTAHRALRFLVEEKGFRTLALEGDDPERLGLDEYVRTGDGDPLAMLAEARPFLRTGEILDVVTWMREHNERHPHDQVRFARLPEGARLEPTTRRELERQLADDVLWWHEHTGDKIVYWGGIAHTAVAPGSLGGHLRERFGSGYLSVGLTFEDGALPWPITAPPADFAETPLSATDLDTFLLDLRVARPEAVRAWLEAPTKTRMIGPTQDPLEHLSDGAFGDWFDVVGHHRHVTPAHLIAG